jgi:hypothetical protein
MRSQFAMSTSYGATSPQGTRRRLPGTLSMRPSRVVKEGNLQACTGLLHRDRENGTRSDAVSSRSRYAHSSPTTNCDRSGFITSPQPRCSGTIRQPRRHAMRRGSTALRSTPNHIDSDVPLTNARALGRQRRSSPPKRVPKRMLCCDKVAGQGGCGGTETRAAVGGGIPPITAPLGRRLAIAADLPIDTLTDCVNADHTAVKAWRRTVQCGPFGSASLPCGLA